ncbi:YibE/F family protein [Anaerocolumna aminovalerica]|uniref:YibE/F family protein n=1 Tax=Anaerocolumna aminovalerica TaxID=1527 RepID=UPI000BE32718|nr:YibE/F family protein [Anaerocolumna aminovalerica]
MKKNLKVKILTAVIMLLVFIGAAIILNRPDPDDVLSSAQKRIFAFAKVTAILGDNASPDTWTEGRRIGAQELEVRILTGKHKGAVLETINYLNAYYNVDAKLGTRLIVRLDYNDTGELYVVSIPNYDRSSILVIALIAFAILMVLVGGKQGARALLGLLFTLLNLWYILIPLVLKGVSSILATILIAAYTSAGALLLLTGYTKKTFCALVGCVGGVIAAGIFAWIITILTPMNGFNMSEAEELVIRASESPLKISGLLVSGILLSALGALMDTSMSIVSALHEVYEQNPSISKKQIFRSGMNIGRDAMGTMANTLILAFVGSAFNLLILFQVYEYPMIQILNSDMMAIEILQGIAGSVGIIATTPLVSALCATIFRFKGNKILTR